MLPKDYTEHKLQLGYYMVQCAIDISLLLYMYIILLPSPSDCVLAVINTGQGVAVPVHVERLSRGTSG